VDVVVPDGLRVQPAHHPRVRERGADGVDADAEDGRGVRAESPHQAQHAVLAGGVGEEAWEAFEAGGGGDEGYGF